MLQDGDSLLIFRPSGVSLETLTSLSFNGRGTDMGTDNLRGGCPLLLPSPTRAPLGALTGGGWGGWEAIVGNSFTILLLFLFLVVVLRVLLSRELSLLFGTVSGIAGAAGAPGLTGQVGHVGHPGQAGVGAGAIHRDARLTAQNTASLLARLPDDGIQRVSSSSSASPLAREVILSKR